MKYIKKSTYIKPYFILLLFYYLDFEKIIRYSGVY